MISITAVSICASMHVRSILLLLLLILGNMVIAVVPQLASMHSYSALQCEAVQALATMPLGFSMLTRVPKRAQSHHLGGLGSAGSLKSALRPCTAARTQ